MGIYTVAPCISWTQTFFEKVVHKKNIFMKFLKTELNLLNNQEETF